jgi:hypothetical protein
VPIPFSSEAQYTVDVIKFKLRNYLLMQLKVKIKNKGSNHTHKANRHTRVVSVQSDKRPE